jgi:hypothetical protein
LDATRPVRDARVVTDVGWIAVVWRYNVITKLVLHPRTLYSETANGRWRSPVSFGRPSAQNMYGMQPLLNDRGQACVVWYRVTGRVSPVDSGSYARFG